MLKNCLRRPNPETPFSTVFSCINIIYYRRSIGIWSGPLLTDPPGTNKCGTGTYISKLDTHLFFFLFFSPHNWFTLQLHTGGEWG